MDDTEIEKRFEFYPATTDDRRAAHHGLRLSCLRLAYHINDELPDGREKSVALTKIEEVMFWSNAGLARQPETQ